MMQALFIGDTNNMNHGGAGGICVHPIDYTNNDNPCGRNAA